MNDFRKGQRYETPYGVAHVASVQRGGLAKFKIERVSAEAARMGWKNGDTFQAHKLDQTSPSPSSWPLISRRNPTVKLEKPRVPMTVRQAMAEQAKARKWFATLRPDEIGTLGDQLVLGDFEWWDWFESKPSAAFMNEVDRQRMLWEMSHSGSGY